MNWLQVLLNWRVSARGFNPWDVLLWPEDSERSVEIEGESDLTQATPQETAPSSHILSASASPPPVSQAAHVPVATSCFEGATDHDVLGIGACVVLPWQFHLTEEVMRDKPRTICVSDRDLAPMRALVTSALKTHGGVTLEYVRLLSEELRQATIMPASRLPRDVVSLNSRVWVTDLDSGQRTVLTLVMPDHAASTPDRISVISPLGMALFGYAAGDRLEWGPFQRPIRLKVDRVRRIRCSHSSHPSHVRLPSCARKDAP